MKDLEVLLSSKSLELGLVYALLFSLLGSRRDKKSIKKHLRALSKE